MSALTRLGADPDATDCQMGATALFAAADMDCVRALVDAGGSVDATDVGGMTALMQAILSGNVDRVGTLLDAGADALTLKAPPGCGWEGFTALRIAEECGMQEVQTQIVERMSATAKAEYDKRQLEYKLLSAVYTGDVAEIERLVAEGVSPNALDNLETSTMLECAVREGNSAVVKVLVKLGAIVADGIADDVARMVDGGAAAANPAAAQGFLDALTAEYVDGVDEAVGKWEDSGASAEGIDVEDFEERVREARDAAEEIATIRGELLGNATMTDQPPEP